MWFEGKIASEITPDEINDLMARGVREDAALDFKRECYKGSDGEVKEMLRDVISFANADGGYILIGVGERESAAAAIHHVPNALNEVTRIRDLCVQCISPRIRDLGIASLTVEPGMDIVIISVPESARRPHMITFKDNTYFCRRYHDGKRTMSMEEIREAFQQQLASTHFGPSLTVVQKMDELLRMQKANRLAELQPSSSISDAISAEEVRRIMEMRFRERVGEEPFFRICCVPMDISNILLDVRSESIRSLLENPPNMRENAWNIYESKALEYTPEGVVSTGYGNQTVVLTSSGYLEFSLSCRDTYFQWDTQRWKEAPPELFPLAVCELPVNFARLVQAVYTETGIEQEIAFSLDYVNIGGFRLRPYAADSTGYLMPHDLRPYPRKDIQARIAGVLPAFVPESAAFDLVRQVYSEFGYRQKHIPYFTSEGRFDIDSRSAEDSGTM